ncbi:oxidoreductase-like domain-containing protein [Undibacterium sp. TJN25]|uniref:oxidoreductase-like domain-containing protein n=1 Tax=Undibacterium sp. TJN25 TaxID=3413056 RepID=UPI003BF4165E
MRTCWRRRMRRPADAATVHCRCEVKMPSSRHPAQDPRPLPPVRPELEDCCNSGCTPCIFDIYEDALERYRTELREWETRNPVKGAAQKLKKNRANPTQG